MGRAAVVLNPGDRNGDIEVVEYLGVIKGFSRVHVRNVTNGLEKTLTTGDFLRAKFKLLNPDQLRAVLVANGERNKGNRLGKSKYRMADVVTAARTVGLELVTNVDQNTLLNPGLSTVRVRCRCGVEFDSPTRRILNLGVKSCGCSKQKYRWAHVLTKLAACNMEAAEKLDQSAPTQTRKISLKCKCGVRFDADVHSVLSGNTTSCGCNVLRVTWNEICQAAANNRLTVLAEPTQWNVNTSTEFKCFCGRTFPCRIYAVYSGNTRSCGCVKSFEQAALARWLEDMGLRVVMNDRTILHNGLELDIVLPDLSIAIEYHGLYWHGESRTNATGRSASRLVDREKMDAARTAGYRLVILFEDEWLRRRSSTEARLRAILGRFDRTVGARKCVVVRPLVPEVREFLEYTHLQGFAGGRYYGLSKNGELLAIAVFAKIGASRGRSGRPGEFELLRFAVKSGVHIPGGFSRLISAFRESEPICTELLSYADTRWSNGAVYAAAGFVCSGTTDSSYWYFKRRYKRNTVERLHRYTLRKSELLRRFGGDPAKTEWQLAQEAGYDRVWDLGTTRWVLSR